MRGGDSSFMGLPGSGAFVEPEARPSRTFMVLAPSEYSPAGNDIPRENYSNLRWGSEVGIRKLQVVPETKRSPFWKNIFEYTEIVFYVLSQRKYDVHEWCITGCICLVHRRYEKICVDKMTILVICRQNGD